MADQKAAGQLSTEHQQDVSQHQPGFNQHQPVNNQHEAGLQQHQQDPWPHTRSSLGHSFQWGSLDLHMGRFWACYWSVLLQVLLQVGFGLATGRLQLPPFFGITTGPKKVEEYSEETKVSH